MGALIATSAYGENDPAVVRAILESLPFVTSRYAHSEYQTSLSLRLKAELNRIAPAGTPRHFVVNTGAEAVENAIKSVLLNRVKTTDDADGGFIVSFEGAFHGRTLGSLAVTHRKKARLGFPTFDWPHIPFPIEEPALARGTARREERSLKQLWDLLVSGRLPHADKSRDTFQREIDAIDEFLARPGQDVEAFVQGSARNLTADVVRRSRRVAAVLVEPIQGEGGVRMASCTVHAPAAAVDEDLRRAAHLRRGADRLGDDRAAVGARALRPALLRPTSSPGRRRRRTASSSSARNWPRSSRKRRSSTRPGRATRWAWCGCWRCSTSWISMQVRRTGERAQARARRRWRATTARS